VFTPAIKYCPDASTDTEYQLRAALLKVGVCDGTREGKNVGNREGTLLVGTTVGIMEGDCDGVIVGFAVGAMGKVDGINVGELLGTKVGIDEGDRVVGSAEGTDDGK
jgi:hypothetical protein